ncbi:MAG: T9SS type B sorting domain-containing protein, partial [Lutibacter sp.]|nr:T9SS type B sorting domain-containing protein [Lutibacter sp.]
FYPSSKITIFNRFGKVMKQFTIKDGGWDGIFNGKQAPSSDYWFYIELVDTSGNIRLKKGHFSLIR